MKKVMIKAWEIARKGQKIFGGKIKEYFAQALKMAWNIVKIGMKKLTGSDAQIKWAESIRKDLIAQLKEMDRVVISNTYEKACTWESRNGVDVVIETETKKIYSNEEELIIAKNEIKLCIEGLENETNAAYIIDNRDSIAKFKNYGVRTLGRLVRAYNNIVEA